MTTTAAARTPVESSIKFDPGELRVTRIRALRGPNYWRLAPVIAGDVEQGALEKVTSADVPGFTERLTGALPSLQAHKCTRGHQGGFPLPQRGQGL